MKLGGPFLAFLTLPVLAACGTGGSTADTVSRPAPVSFVRFDAGLPTSGQWRQGFRVADMNKDGHPDIVHGPARKQMGTPVIFLGDGKGAWARWNDARFPALPYDYGDVEVADFDRNGHQDIAMAMHLRGFAVLKNDGQGGFSDASEGLDFDAKAVPGFSSRAIRTADWNGDELTDIVAVSEGPGMSGTQATVAPGGVAVFLNEDSKGWRRADSAIGKGIFSDSIALGDFDGDGRQDLATGSGSMDRKDLVTLSRGEGAAGSVALPPLELAGEHQFVQGVAAGDFDRDGRDDLAVAYQLVEKDVWSSVIDVFYSRSGDKWERRALYREDDREGPVTMAAGHLTDKNRRDLVALTSRGDMLVFLGDGSGTLVPNSIPLPNYGEGCRGSHVELADLDGDGRDEIVAAFAYEPAPDRCPSGGGITAWKAQMDQ